VTRPMVSVGTQCHRQINLNCGQRLRLEQQRAGRPSAHGQLGQQRLGPLGH
jgi:hypothetical protein